jgi:hypothetical protein
MKPATFTVVPEYSACHLPCSLIYLSLTCQMHRVVLGVTEINFPVLGAGKVPKV